MLTTQLHLFIQIHKVKGYSINHISRKTCSFTILYLSSELTFRGFTFGYKTQRFVMNNSR